MDDIANLAHGELTEEQAKELVRTAKKGLTPIQFASLRTAIQTDRLMELLDADTSAEEPTQADRIENLLEKIVEALEQQNARLSSIERTLATRFA
jgi:hypothetical protein